MAVKFNQLLAFLTRVVVDSNTDQKDGLVKRVRDQNDRILEKIQELLNQKQLQKKTLITLLTQLADKFREQNRQLKIAKTSFASAGVTGGILSVVGIGLAPFTFGASLIVSAVGGGIMVASGSGGLSAFIAEKVIIRNLWKQVGAEIQKQVEIELKICEVVKQIAAGGGIAGGTGGIVFKGLKLADVIGDLETVVGGIATAAKTVKTGTSHAKTLAAITTGGRVIHFGEFDFTLAAMAFDVYKIVNTSKKIHKDSPCDAEKQLRDLIARLENEDAEDEDEEED